MIEIPESINIANQINEKLFGKTIFNVVANYSPHKFAFYHGDPKTYGELLSGQKIGESKGLGSMVEISAEDRRIVLSEGANIRFFKNNANIPLKHQFLLEFDDGSVLVVSIQMYGAIQVFMKGYNENRYYLIAREKPSPLHNEFDLVYFNGLRSEETNALSAKAFLATQQRIPGLGNGVVQDILFNSGIHPKRKMNTIDEKEYIKLFYSVKCTLGEMVSLGGRDTEKDLFGRKGGYKTLLSKKTVGKPCILCGTVIEKTSYLGGVIYWCPKCQPF